MNLGRLASLSRHAHGMRTACAHMACARDETKRASGSPCHADGALYACGVTKDCLTDLERRRYQTWWTLADHPGCRGHHQSPIPRRPGPPWPRRPTAAQTATRGLRRFGGRTWTEQKLRVLASEAKDAEMLAKEVATEAAILVEGLNGQEGAPETTLLVVDPQLSCCSTWQSFVQLSWTLQERAIHGQGFAELLQIVLFHPAAVHSVYAEGPPDAADFTIRSPFPTIHLLRYGHVRSPATRTRP
ncbi:unnamed protein product [Durusdinium trenchii]|uniref:Uncharacterized protein n=1 Tax=Durusdinium trenchii TaxID=1381693 RepID=A0ABP0MHC0_9DINO